MSISQSLKNLKSWIWYYFLIIKCWPWVISRFFLHLMIYFSTWWRCCFLNSWFMFDLFQIRNCCFLFDEKNWTQTNRNDITCYWLNKENQSEIESIFERYILRLLRARNRKSGNKTTWIAEKNVIML